MPADLPAASTKRCCRFWRSPSAACTRRVTCSATEVTFLMPSRLTGQNNNLLADYWGIGDHVAWFPSRVHQPCHVQRDLQLNVNSRHGGLLLSTYSPRSMDIVWPVPLCSRVVGRKGGLTDVGDLPESGSPDPCCGQ